MTYQNTATPAVDPNAPVVTPQVVYLKDCSFESPNGPFVGSLEGQPAGVSGEPDSSILRPARSGPHPDPTTANQESRMLRRSFPLACLLTLSACAGAPTVPATAPVGETPPGAPVATPRPSGVLLANFDRSVRPQDDLYRYVNGNWLATTEIPADKSNYSVALVLQDEVANNLRAIAEESAARTDAPVGSPQQLIGDFYATYMDEVRANELGTAPLASPLAEIDTIRDCKGLVEYFGRAQRHYYSPSPNAEFGVPAPLRSLIQPDARNPEVYTGPTG